MNFIEITEKLWHTYFFGDKNGSYNQIELFDPECVIIGTGKHEFYRNMQEFAETIESEIAEREHIHFQYKDFWCEEKRISEDVCLVYGSLFIWWESDDKQVVVNMDSRFSIIYKNTKNGWKIVHVHQSIPNFEQKDGEYYPKTLSEEYRREKEKVSELIELAEKDGLTQLMNYRTFKKLYAEYAEENSWFFIVDVDDFKSINDTYGHMVGNCILQEIAAILQETVGPDEIVCRMGGDEFIFICSKIYNRKSIEKILEHIQSCVGKIQIGENHKVTLSIGGTSTHKEESLYRTFERADKALYKAKATGKNQWIIG